MRAQDRLVVRNELAELERLSGFLSAFWEKHRLPPDLELDINLAVEEVFCNVVRHGYQDAAAHEIVVCLLLEDGLLSVSVEDDGVAFNPLEAPAPVLDGPLDERPVGGLGVHLIRSVADDVKYRREGNRNHLVLKKRMESNR